jgi:hypothetical protein
MGLFKKPLRHSGEELNGLGMYRGMEVNYRQQDEFGLAKMARMNSEIKRSRRVSEIADGVRRGEMMEDIMDVD